MDSKDRKLQPAVKLMFVNENKFFGPGPVELLKEIEVCGNVRDACEKCGFSYSKGWTILKRCEEELGYRIVYRQAGGQSGGAAKVTDKGRDLIAIYEILESELDEIARKRFDEIVAENNFDI